MEKGQYVKVSHTGQVWFSGDGSQGFTLSDAQGREYRFYSDSVVEIEPIDQPETLFAPGAVVQDKRNSYRFLTVGGGKYAGQLYDHNEKEWFTPETPISDKYYREIA